MRAHNLDLDGQTRPAGTAPSTAVPCILLIRMKSQVQVQPGPPQRYDQRNADQAETVRMPHQPGGLCFAPFHPGLVGECGSRLHSRQGGRATHNQFPSIQVRRVSPSCWLFSKPS